ncbi:MAG: carboxypeptidase regulatory-like domain-containing protein [Planctomycetes bacterium]|nr:carboxypeptidase regulatory-like domain-containing protein [Planctomycetota bacterium]
MARGSFGVFWAVFALAASGHVVAQNEDGTATRPAAVSGPGRAEEPIRQEYWEGTLLYGEDRTPAAGLQVSLVSDGLVLGTTKSDASGKFRLPRPRGRYWLQATDGHTLDFSGISEPLVSRSFPTFLVKSFSTLELKFPGLDRLGIPYVDVKVASNAPIRRIRGRANGDGELILNDMIEELHGVHVYDPDRVLLAFHRVATKKREKVTKEIALPKTGQAAGRLRVIGGQPISGLRVQALPLDPPLSDGEEVAAEVLADGAGNYRFHRLAPSRYVIRIHAAEVYPVQSAHLVTVASESSAQVPDLWYSAQPSPLESSPSSAEPDQDKSPWLDPQEWPPTLQWGTGAVHGVVMTDHGEALPFAQIDLWQSPRVPSSHYVAFADELGRFDLGSISGKGWTVQASPRGISRSAPVHWSAPVALDPQPGKKQQLNLEVAFFHGSDAASRPDRMGPDAPLVLRAIAKGVPLCDSLFVIESRTRACRGWTLPRQSKYRQGQSRRRVGTSVWTDLGVPEPAGDEAAICYGQGESSRGCVSAATVGRPLVHTATRGWCDFQLSDAAIVGKMVSTETNLPLRAVLRLEPDGELVRSGAPFSIATVESDAEGTFVLQRVAPGPYELVVERGKHGDRAEPGQRMPVTVRGDGIERVRWAVRPGASLVVKVVDATGAPIANAHVTLRPKPGDGTPQGATTRERGAATFHSLIDGPVLVEAVELLEPGSSRAARKSEPLHAVIRKDAQQTLQIALLPRVVVRVEADGAEPEVLGRLRLRVYDADEREMPIGRSDWEPNTTYREFVSHLRSGEYTLEATAPGLPMQIIPFRVGADPVEPIRVRLKAK